MFKINHNNTEEGETLKSNKKGSRKNKKPPEV